MRRTFLGTDDDIAPIKKDTNGHFDSDSNSDTCPEQHYERLNSGKPYVSPSSQEEPEVEYATEYYSESPVRPSLSPATKKREHDELEAEMDAMSSMSESELQAQVQAIMDARERKKQEETRKFLEYRSSLKGEEDSQRALTIKDGPHDEQQAF